MRLSRSVLNIKISKCAIERFILSVNTTPNQYEIGKQARLRMKVFETFHPFEFETFTGKHLIKRYRIHYNRFEALLILLII